MSTLTSSQINEKYQIKDTGWKFYHSTSFDLCERIKLVIPTVSDNTLIYKYEGVHGHYERINTSYSSPKNSDPWNREFKIPTWGDIIMTNRFLNTNKITSNKIVRGLVRGTSVEGNVIYCIDYLWISEEDFDNFNLS